MSILRPVIGFLLCFIFSATANADVLFENPFPPGPSTGWNPGGTYRVYDSFILSSDSTLTGFEFGNFHSTALSSFTLNIFTDTTFNTSVFSNTFSGSQITTTPTSGGSSIVGVDLPNLFLSAGTYWANPVRVSGSMAINVSIPDLDGSLIQVQNGINVFHRGDDMAMRVLGTGQNSGVPAPGAIVLLGIGLFSLGVRRRTA